VRIKMRRDLETHALSPGRARLALLTLLLGASSLTALAGGAAMAAAAPGTAYVTNEGSGSVTPIEVATNEPGAEIQVGSGPEGIAITPDGKTAYVANVKSFSVTPIELATNKAGNAIKVGGAPEGIAITPDGKTAYVTNAGSGTVTPIELATNKAGREIKVVGFGIAITPDGKTAYVTDRGSATVTPIDLATNTPGAEIKVGNSPQGIAIATTPPAPPPPMASAQAPPAISAASLTNRRFRVGRQATAVSAAKAPIGTAFRFTLSAPAKLQIAITRLAPGLRHGRGCLAPTAKLKRAHAKRCTRTLIIGTLTRASEPPGADRVSFSGRIGHRALSPGPYSAALRASNAAGRSKPLTLSFTVLRR
jgi:YVTN family beta-propeller protein